MTRLELIKIPKIDRVQLLDKFGSRATTGSLFITTTHVIFVSEDKKENWILHSHIGSVEKGVLTVQGCPLTIRCKTFLVLSLLVPREKECHEAFISITQLSQPVNIKDVYAFSYVSSLPNFDKNDGWNLYDVSLDFQRQGIPNADWVETSLNEEYKLCDTYPQVLYVPKSAPTTVLIASSKFRSRNRLPVLAYWYLPTKASITRCSQPLAGFSARCVEDEQMFQHILDTNRDTCSVLYVIDTRPKVNAMVNKAAGKGFENEAFYQNMKSYFFAIENIHVMRSSLLKLLSVCSQSNMNISSFLGGLEDSGWLSHVRSVLEAGIFVAEGVSRGISCVVHCSDGWDRTSQTISLACLILDPFYRSIAGFQTLLEKDWLSFGHKFSDRLGHTCQASDSGASKEMSPVFTQFLDAVWQLLIQFPEAFQFNERYLVTLHDHAHSCQFGTFLGNCQKDRIDLRLSEQTYSLWGFLARYTDEYINPYYDPLSDVAKGILPVSIRPQSIQFWSGMYNRFDDGIYVREPSEEKFAMLRNHVSSLKEQQSWLSQKIAQLRTSLGKGPGNLKSPDSIIPLVSLSDSGVSIFHSEASSYSSGSSANPNKNCPTRQSDGESGFEEPSSPVGDGKCRDRPVFTSTPKSVGGLHPLMQMSQSMTQSLDLSMVSDLDQLPVASDLNSVSMRWTSLRNMKQCSSAECAIELRAWMKRHYCYKCGNAFCAQCCRNQASLAAMMSAQPVPVCRACFSQTQEACGGLCDYSE